jgi:hypothetical protein
MRANGTEITEDVQLPQLQRDRCNILTRKGRIRIARSGLAHFWAKHDEYWIRVDSNAHASVVA